MVHPKLVRRIKCFEAPEPGMAVNVFLLALEARRASRAAEGSSSSASDVPSCTSLPLHVRDRYSEEHGLRTRHYAHLVQRGNQQPGGAMDLPAEGVQAIVTQSGQSDDAGPSGPPADQEATSSHAEGGGSGVQQAAAQGASEGNEDPVAAEAGEGDDAEGAHHHSAWNSRDYQRQLQQKLIQRHQEERRRKDKRKLKEVERDRRRAKLMEDLEDQRAQEIAARAAQLAALQAEHAAVEREAGEQTAEVARVSTELAAVQVRSPVFFRFKSRICGLKRCT